MKLTPELRADFDKALLNGDAVTVEALIKHPSIIKYIESDYSFLDRILSSEKKIEIALKKKYTKIVLLLLEIEAVRNNAAAFNNYLISLAVSLGDNSVVEKLLEIEAVRNNAARFNTLLLYSVDRGYIKIFKLLSGIEAVKKYVEFAGPTILQMAVYRGRTEIVELLLSIESIENHAADLHNIELRTAVMLGHTNIVKLFLNIPCVIREIASLDHEVLHVAVSTHRWDSILILLQHYRKSDIPYFLMNFILKVPVDHPAATEIKALIFCRPMIMGAYTQAKILWMHQWIAHWGFRPWEPDKPINDANLGDYFFEQAAHCAEPKQAAIILMTFNHILENYLQNIAEVPMGLGDNESAMEEILVLKVTKHYTEEVEPTYSKKFNALGGIENVEKLIKTAILESIIDKADEPLKFEIRSKKQGIIDGVIKDITWARSKFTAKDDIYQTAWRAYDPGAQTLDWESLLTAPSANASESEKMRSDTIRRMSAYYYLVSMDERLSQVEHEDAWDSYVAAIAEIRRAHNTDKSEVDSPSCYPGHLTRLYEVTKRNPYISNFKPGLVMALKETYINALVIALTAGFIACDETQALALCEALTMLTRVTAEDIALNIDEGNCLSVSDVNDNRYNADLVKIRIEFIVKYLPFDALNNNLIAKIKEKYQIDMNYHDRVLLQALLIDVGGGEAAPYITSAYQKRIEALNQKTAGVSSPVQVSINTAVREQSDSLNTVNAPMPH